MCFLFRVSVNGVSTVFKPLSLSDSSPPILLLSLSLSLLPSLPQLRKDQRKVIFKRVEQYVKEAKVVFVVRIRGLACCVCAF